MVWKASEDDSYVKWGISRKGARWPIFPGNWYLKRAKILFKDVSFDWSSIAFGLNFHVIGAFEWRCVLINWLRTALLSQTVHVQVISIFFIFHVFQTNYYLKTSLLGWRIQFCCQHVFVLILQKSCHSICYSQLIAHISLSSLWMSQKITLPDNWFRKTFTISIIFIKMKRTLVLLF